MFFYFQQKNTQKLGFVYSLKKCFAYDCALCIRFLTIRTVETEYCKAAVPISLKLKQTKTQNKCLTKVEQQKIENYILQNNKTYNFGILISMYTGLRIGEIVALKWSDIDLKNNLIKVNRTTCKKLPKTIR